MVIDVRTSQWESVDFRGMPDVTHIDGKAVTSWALPDELPFVGVKKFEDFDGIIILFLDEFNGGTKSVESVMYQLVHDRRVGAHNLLPNVRIVAAGNRDGDRGVTNKMADPVANRFTHGEVVPDVKQWSEDYAPKAGLDPKAVAFYRWKPELFNTFDPTNRQQGKAFATPRTVEKAIRYLMKSDRPEHVKRTQVAGAVGAGHAAELFGFLELFDKVVPMSEILADPEGARIPSKSEPSLCYATAAAISGAMTEDNAGTFTRYLERFDVDLLVLAWLMAIQRDNDIMRSDAYIPLAKKYKEVFQVAN